ncbi:unnamed protein product, partial [marine sediment metagenome]
IQKYVHIIAPKSEVELLKVYAAYTILVAI